MDDDLVVEEEHEVGATGEHRSGGVGPPLFELGEARQAQAQIGEPRERPFRRGALHDEVAGEAPPVPCGAPRPVLIGRGRIERVRLRLHLPPALTRRRGRPSQPGGDDPAAQSRLGGGVDEAHRRREGGAQAGDEPAGLPRRRSVHRPEDGDLRLLPGRDDPLVDESGVEVAAAPGLGHRPVAGHRGERPGLELGDVG